MGKSRGAKQQVTDYFMSIHFGIATQVDAITGIYVNEKPAWEDNVGGDEPHDILINRADLFGGNKREGGLVGTATYLPGSSTQVLPENLATKFGLTSATAPAFRGVSTLFFHGDGFFNTPDTGGLSAIARLVVLKAGSGAQSGFLWTSNNPVVAQTVWARVVRAPKGLDPAKAMIGPDANPAHMIYECLTNLDWGMGASASSIDIDSFNAAATTLFDESFGLSMIWTRQTMVESFVTEVLDHIEGSLFIDPRTGLQTLKLIRGGYNVETLPVITPDNADLTDFQRKFPGEVINEITVTWTNPLNEQDETVTVQNLSAIERQGGQIVPNNPNYYGARNSQLANKLAIRDLRAASAPLGSGSVRLLREFWSVVPGDVVRLAWPSEDGEPAINAVVRITTVDYGKIGSPYIQASIIEDVFSLTLPPLTAPPVTEWVDPAVPPAPMAAVQIFTLPYYLVTSTAFGADASEPVFPEVVAGVLASPPNDNTRTYELVAETVNPAGATVLENIGNRDPVARVVTTAALTAQNTSTISPAALGVGAASPLVNGLLLIGSNEATQEIALVTGVVSGNFTVNRGVLDTIPRAWPSGTPVWLLNPGLRIADEQIGRSSGEAANYKLLPTTSLGTLLEADAPLVSGTLTARPYRPLRPANVRINGQAFGDVSSGALSTITVDWATRNRLFEDSVILGQSAGPVSPEYKQRTIVRVYNDATNALLVTYNHLWTQNQLVLQKSWFDRFAAIRIEVLSERDGLESFQFTSRRLTGFANNPAAPLPPAPPAAGTAPPLAAAPGVGAFSLVSSTVGVPGGDVVPALVVTGTQNDIEADGLVVRYKLAASPDWMLLPTVGLTGAAVWVEIAPVAANSTYDVEVAYLYNDGTPSQWRSLGQAVTADILISGQSSASLVADAATAKADSASALSTLSSITSDAVLSRDEKPAVRQQRDAITAEYPTILARAVSFSVSSATYTATYTDLLGYLATVALDTASDTGIVRSTFNGRFVDYYTARQTLLDGIALVASQRANIMPNGTNLISFSRYEGGRGWIAVGVGMTIDPIVAGTPDGINVVQVTGTATAAGQLIGFGPEAEIVGRPGDRFSISGYIEAYAVSGAAPAVWQWFVEYLSGTTVVGFTNVAAGTGNRARAYYETFVEMPAGATVIRVRQRVDSGGSAVLLASLGDLMLARTVAGQTRHPRYSPGPNAANGADVTRDVLPTLNRDDWAPGAYRRGDIVKRNGSSYFALEDHTALLANAPPSALWASLADRGDDGEQGTTGVSAPPIKALPTGAAQFDPIRLENGQTITVAANLFLTTAGATVGACSIELQISVAGTGTWEMLAGGFVSDTQPITEPVELNIAGATFTNTSGAARMYNIRLVSVRRGRTVNEEQSNMRVI